MKLILTLVLGCLLLTATASATFITCGTPNTIATFTNGSGSAVALCPGLASVPPGMRLDSIDIRYMVDYQFGVLPAGNDLVVVFTPSIGVVPGPTTIHSVGGTSSGSIATTTISSASGLDLDFFAAFTVSEFASVAAGGAATSSAMVQVQYNLVEAEVPEPATLALIGAPLIALGFVRRRRV